VKMITPGCPASCTEQGGGVCTCWCAALNMCPPGPPL
jgi:hypothetical protein